ncbi:MAG: hypothetical protein HY273_00855 [Gammaproteobacteria bacterium]|nr:hypothetical protein [Gammaproteobacteria bacterium]
MTRAHIFILFVVSLLSGACMSAPTQSQTPPQPPVGYTGMDDVLIPTPAVPVTIQSEMYPLDVVSSGGVDDDVETTTMVYITSESFIAPTSTQDLAERWITRHSDQKSKFHLLSHTAVESRAIPTVLDEKGKVFSPPYTLIFESHGAVDYPWDGLTKYYDKDRYRQMFYFLPVSANQIVTARVVREVKYFEGFPQFESQYEHFLATLKRDVATPQSTFKGSIPRTRRFYTAYFSFEIFLREADGGNQWLINKTSSQRSDVWHTQDGDVTINMGIVSGYDFDPVSENHKLKEDAKALVKKLPALVKSMGEKEFKSKLTYIETPFGTQSIYGHTDDGGLETEVVLEGAYKTGKKFRVYIKDKSTAVSALLPQLYAWLAQFRVLQ